MSEISWTFPCTGVVVKDMEFPAPGLVAVLVVLARLGSRKQVDQG